MPRNKLLSNVLFRLELIEAYGTGIGRMRDSYEGSGLQPSIRVTANTFTVELPNRNADLPQKIGNADLDTNARSLLSGGSPRTRREIQEALGISQTAAIRLLNSLEADGHVRRIGGGKNTRYMISR